MLPGIDNRAVRVEASRHRARAVTSSLSNRGPIEMPAKWRSIDTGDRLAAARRVKNGRMDPRFRTLLSGEMRIPKLAARQRSLMKALRNISRGDRGDRGEEPIR